MSTETQKTTGGFMAGAHAYASLAQALKDGEKRLSVLKKVTVGSPKVSGEKTKATAKQKSNANKK